MIRILWKTLGHSKLRENYDRIQNFKNSICTKAYFCFNGQNCSFNLSRTIELMTRNSDFSIINEFPRNDMLVDTHTLRSLPCIRKIFRITRNLVM